MKKIKILLIIIGIIGAISVVYYTVECKEYSIKLFRTEGTLSKTFEYQIIINSNSTVIAKRIYQNGKTIFEEGTIPMVNYINETTIKPIRSSGEKSKDVIGAVYYKKGKIVAERYTNNLTGKSYGYVPDGVVIERYNNGKIKNIFVYNKGYRNGPALGFYPNGQVKAESLYINDYPSGVGRRYYENGNLMAEWEMRDKKEIYHKEYDEAGGNL